MKHAIGTIVKVGKGVDDTFDESFLDLVGFVIDHNAEGMVGNTEENPLQIVEFDFRNVSKNHPHYREGLVQQSFWYEELIPVAINVELLEALKECIHAYDKCTMFDSDGSAFDKARELIKKLC